MNKYKRRTGWKAAAYVAWVLWAILGLIVLLVLLMEANILAFLASVAVWWVAFRKLQEFGGEPPSSGF